MRHYFWGIFLIASGIFLLVKHYLNLNIPTGRILIGLFIISLGLSILIGGFEVSGSNKVIFGTGRLEVMKVEEEYNVIFSKGIVDLTGIPADLRKIEVNTIFAATDLILPSDGRVTIKANAAFASTEFPDSANLTFGDRVYRLNPGDTDKSEVIVELNTVFGRTDIRIR